MLELVIHQLSLPNVEHFVDLADDSILLVHLFVE